MPAHTDSAVGIPSTLRTLGQASATLVAVMLIGAACAGSPNPTSTASITPTGSPAPTVSAAPSHTSSPTPAASSTEGPTPTPTAAPKAAAATVDELVDRLYTALSSDDTAALHGLSAPGARHSVWYADSESSSEISSFLLEEYDPVDDEMSLAAPTGDPLVVGDFVAVPVSITYPAEVDTGFDFLSIVHFQGGLLVGDAATIYGAPGLTVDAATAEIIDTEVAAWSAGNADDVLATMTDTAVFWEGLADPDRTEHSGDDLVAFVNDSLWIDVEITGDAIISGTFVAVPNRLTSSTDPTDHGDGISVYEIRDGRINLQVYAGE